MSIKDLYGVVDEVWNIVALIDGVAGALPDLYCDGHSASRLLDITKERLTELARGLDIPNVALIAGERKLEA